MEDNARLVISYADGDSHGAPFEDLVYYIMTTDCVESIDIIAPATDEEDARVIRTIKIERGAACKTSTRKSPSTSSALFRRADWKCSKRPCIGTIC